MKSNKNQLSRRKFLGNAALAGMIGAAGIHTLASCSRKGKSVEYAFPPLLEKAPDGPALKAGLVGCGGRGTGAAINFLNAGPNLQLVAMADIFQDKLDNSRKEIKEKTGVEVPDDRCFLGFDAYKRVLESDVDIMLLVTPPYFRPEHFKASIEARKHVFMEKPVAVDPVGARSIIATGRQAETMGLTVVTGTQRRHQRDYLETYRQFASGMIGELVSANCYWNQSKLWHRERQDGWSDMEWMLRDWVNWSWLSGDHIVEQHIHNIDVINWYAGEFPERAVSFGARHRRPTGDQYDMFSTDFIYPGEIHMHSMCRQIDGCTNNVSEFVRGTQGYTNCVNTLYNPDGSEKWTYTYANEEDAGRERLLTNPYDQEHIDMITAIRKDEPVNEAERTAKTNLTAIMGRMSAYTGKEVTWEELMKSTLSLGPEKVELGPVDFGQFEIPVPGTPPA